MLVRLLLLLLLYLGDQLQDKQRIGRERPPEEGEYYSLMSEPNLNDERYEERLAFVRELVSNRFGFSDASITTLAYTHNVPFAFNNFLYTVTLAHPPQAHAAPSAAPDTAPIPPGTHQLILRLTNTHPATGLNNANRIQNEVAGASFARSALAQTPYAHIVPEIYDWEAGDGTPDGSQGWILMEAKQGVNGEEVSWSDIPEDQWELLTSELADVVSALKAHALPEGLDGIGGLTYDAQGRVISGEMTLLPLHGGPWKDYKDMWGSMLDNALRDADDSPVLRGWRDSDLRARIDMYRREGLKQEIDSLNLDQRLAYSHSDYGTGNVLFSPHTFKLTALLDFDWGYISYQHDDFLRTLHTVHGSFPCGAELSGEEAALQQAMLSGFPSAPVLTDPIEDRIARLWDGALEERGVMRPRELKHIRELSDLKLFCENVAPFRLVMAPMVRRLGEEKVKTEREAVAKTLDAWLSKRGY